MSNIVSGEVQFISKSPKGFYSLKVDDVWYGYGMVSPKCEKGAAVTFNYTAKGDFKMVDGETFEVSKAAAPSSGTGGGKSGGSDRDKYWTDKAESDKVQQRIREYHAARSTAVETVSALINAGAIKLPATEAKKYDALLSIVDELTNRYFSDIEGRFHADGGTADSDMKAEEE